MSSRSKSPAWACSAIRSSPTRPSSERYAAARRRGKKEGGTRESGPRAPQSSENLRSGEPISVLAAAVEHLAPAGQGRARGHGVGIGLVKGAGHWHHRQRVEIVVIGIKRRALLRHRLQLCRLHLAGRSGHGGLVGARNRRKPGREAEGEGEGQRLFHRGTPERINRRGCLARRKAPPDTARYGDARKIISITITRAARFI